MLRNHLLALPALFLISPMAGCSQTLEQKTVAGTSSVRPQSVQNPSLLVISEDGHTFNLGTKQLPPEEYLKVEMAKMTRSFSGDSEQLYSRLPNAVDFSFHLPEVAHQGGQNSCTGWALGYAVKSMQENRELGWGLKDPTHLFSPSYIYNQANEGRDEGAYLIDAIKVLEQVGTVPLTYMPYNETDFLSQPNQDLQSMGGAFKALGYRRLNEKDVNLIKSYLATGEPVVLIIELFKPFLKKGMEASQGVYREVSGESYGGHAVVAVGYDNQTQGIKILNSWGRDWGLQGYGWIDYALFPKVVHEAYVVYDTPTPRHVVAKIDTKAQTNHEPAVATIPTEAQPSGQSVPNTVTIDSGEKLLIIPEEAGITTNQQWLRLGDSINDVPGFLSARTSPLFTNYNPNRSGIRIAQSTLVQNQNVGEMEFSRDGRIPVMTNQGVGMGTPRSEVRRIYQEPDVVDEKYWNADRYFYHGISEDWGGIKFARNASLAFYYDKQERVERIKLSLEIKQSYFGTHFVRMEKNEQTIRDGKERITSEFMNFSVPPFMKEIKKADWGELGYGYFISPAPDELQSLIIKVFRATTMVTPELLDERVQIDIKGHIHLSHSEQPVEQHAGINWRVFHAHDGELHFYRYFGFKGDHIFQLTMIAQAPLPSTPWMGEVLQSMEVP